MTTIDLTPLYRNTVGFDRLATMLDRAFSSEQGSSSYPPYDIEAIDNDRYVIALAVAGFGRDELDVQIEKGVLTVKGQKPETEEKHNFLYQGIAARSFERKFNLADHVKITHASLKDGLLRIDLKHEIPEAMKPKRIEINTDDNTLEHQSESGQAA